MINIVIPMAGAGSRFSKVGYKKPKPFIDVNGEPMIVRVLENLSYPNARFILIAREEHIKQEAQLIQEISKKYNALFIPIEHLTEGTAATVLFARKYINNTTPLLIANSDQIVDIDIRKFIDDCKRRELDGSILTFIDKEQDPKWSFAKVDKNNLVTEVKEKVAISEIATVGIYLYAQGSSYVNAAIDMIVANDRVSNEFYTCPTYNYAIRDGLKIGIFNIEQNQMHGIGTPDDLNSYLKRMKK
jgi:dTDP-glucose pyrophosphorylase